MTLRLIITDPPHPDNWDAVRVAAELGLIATEARTKANYGVPEIWVASDDHADVDARFERLREAGLRVILADEHELAAIPAPGVVTGVAVTETAFAWQLHEGFIEPPADSRVVIVHSQPRETVEFFRGGTGAIGAGFRAGARRAAMMRMGMTFGAAGLAAAAVAANVAQSPSERAAMEPTAIRGQGEGFLDCYFLQPGRLARVQLPRSGVDYSGLGAFMKSTAKENLETLLGLVHERFRNVRVDTRLVGASQRQTQVVGLGLNTVAERLGVGGRPLSPFDLSSRLVFLTAFRAAD